MEDKRFVGTESGQGEPWGDAQCFLPLPSWWPLPFQVCLAWTFLSIRQVFSLEFVLNHFDVLQTRIWRSTAAIFSKRRARLCKHILHKLKDAVEYKIRSLTCVSRAHRCGNRQKPSTSFQASRQLAGFAMCRPRDIVPKTSLANLFHTHGRSM